jgi:formylglycine-generating enzyme
MNRLLLSISWLCFTFIISTINANSSVDHCLDNTAYKNMIRISAGTFSMGCDIADFIDTRPIHQVHINTFWLDKTLVTNKQFARFVLATHYVTIAERKPLAKDFPGAPAKNLVPGALVFTPPKQPVSLDSYEQWWRYVPGANWKHPEGPRSNLNNRWNHPVVQIAYDDAVACACWAGKRLPTEAEFEYAARGGLNNQKFSWGNNLKPNGKWAANIWQGNFPSDNAKEDGFYTTSPVASFPANGYGLYDMTGNVWEWCSDWYCSNYYQSFDSKKVADNPKGPLSSYDPMEAGVKKRVQRGGSFLCSDQYCARYLVGARGKGEPSSGCSNVGFRCAYNP